MRDVSPRQAHDPRRIGGRLKWTKLAASCRIFCRSMTKKFVDGHLAQCAACRAELDALKTDVKPAPVSAQPLRDLKRQLRRKKLAAVLLAVTLALTLATAGFAYLTAPQYLPYSETEWAISRSPSALADDGSAADGLSDLSGAESISVSLLVPVSGAEVTNTQDPNSGKTIYFITAWRTPLDTWRGAFDKTGGAPNTHSANDRTQREADALQGVLAKAESARTLFTLDAANGSLLFSEQRAGRCAALRQHERRHHFSAEAGVGLLRFAIVSTPYYAGYCIFRLPQEENGQSARLSRAGSRELSCRSSTRQGFHDDELPDAARLLAHYPRRRADLRRGHAGDQPLAAEAGEGVKEEETHSRLFLFCNQIRMLKAL